jgi:mannose-1-phosphate guanylyltransferase
VRAIVLIGGEGTRLRPLTWRTPKQLVPILNRPLLEQLLSQLQAHGCQRVTFAMSSPNQAIENSFGDGTRLDLKIERIYEGTPLGSGGAIANASQDWNETFLVCNGDIVSDIDLTAFTDSHKARNAKLSLTLYEVRNPSRYGVVVLDHNSRVTQFVEKPPPREAPSNLINAGIWIFESEVARDLDFKRFNRVEDELFPNLAKANEPIYGYKHTGYWADIGTPDAYLKTNLQLLEGVIPEFLPNDWPTDGKAVETATLDANAQIEGRVLLGAKTNVGKGARLDSGVVTGERCTIKRYAQVSGSVLWEGATIGEGALVRNSVLADGAYVGAGAVLENAVLGHNTSIDANEKPPPGLHLNPESTYCGGKVTNPATLRTDD